MGSLAFLLEEKGEGDEKKKSQLFNDFNCYCYHYDFYLSGNGNQCGRDY
jgi:hypothetical protein